MRYTECHDARAIMNHSTPLWVCENAMNMQHECIYVKCSSCYRHPEGRALGKRSKKAGSCDHERLQPFEEEAYYKAPYIDNMDDEPNFPKECVDCNRTIYSMASVGM